MRLKGHEFDVFAKPFKNIDLKDMLRRTLKEYPGDIIELQQDQLSSGLASDGTELKPPYRPKTIELKNRKGQRTDVVTLKDTGKFYKQQFVKFGRDDAEVTSRSKKTQELVNKYFGSRGGEVFGLTEESMAILGSRVLMHLQQIFREKLLK